MKKIDLLIGELVLAVLAIGVRLYINLRHCMAANSSLQQTGKENADHLKKLIDAISSTERAELELAGKVVLFRDMAPLISGRGFPSDIEPGKNKLVLVFSELSCNVCQDHETLFAVKTAKRIQSDRVFACIYSSDDRYVQNFIRIHRVNFQVFQCKTDDFLKVNGFNNTPLVLALDDRNQVVAAHLPIAGRPELSRGFHDFCTTFLSD